jgi:hypothetical protein
MPRSRKKKDRIVRVSFNNGYTMMFGNSYKPWEMQFEEYLLMLRNSKKDLSISNVEVSDEPWVAWGGLKWCPSESFQEQLNREGCQSDEPDNQNPRQYNLMRFYIDEQTLLSVKEKVSNISRGIY